MSRVKDKEPKNEALATLRKATNQLRIRSKKESPSFQRFLPFHFSISNNNKVPLFTSFIRISLEAMGFGDYFSIPIFFIIFRETTEAAIIVSVLLSFLSQVLTDDSPMRKRLARQVKLIL